MNNRVALSDIRGQVDETLSVLRRYTPAPQSDYYSEYDQALVALENISLALYVRSTVGYPEQPEESVSMAAFADEVLRICQPYGGVR